MKLTIDNQEYKINEIKIKNFYTEDTSEILFYLQHNNDDNKQDVLVLNLNMIIDNFQ